jgi:hypothetical protein
VEVLDERTYFEKEKVVNIVTTLLMQCNVVDPDQASMA